jgi:hypothetical protein
MGGRGIGDLHERDRRFLIGRLTTSSIADDPIADSPMKLPIPRSPDHSITR